MLELRNYIDETQRSILKKAQIAGYDIIFKPRHADADEDGYLAIINETKGTLNRVIFTNTYHDDGITDNERDALQFLINEVIVSDLSILDTIANIDTIAPSEKKRLFALVTELPAGWRREFYPHNINERLYYQQCCMRLYTPIYQLDYIITCADNGYYISLETYTLGGAKLLHPDPLSTFAEIIEIAQKHYDARQS